MSEKIPAPLRMAQRLGKRILGDQAVEKITAAKKQGALRYGPRVAGASEPVAPVAPEPDPNHDGRTSIPEIKAALAAHPAALDSFITVELADPTPRKGALRLLLDAENARTDQPARDETVTALTAALEKLG